MPSEMQEFNRIALVNTIEHSGVSLIMVDFRDRDRNVPDLVDSAVLLPKDSIHYNHLLQTVQYSTFKLSPFFKEPFGFLVELLSIIEFRLPWERRGE